LTDLDRQVAGLKALAQESVSAALERFAGRTATVDLLREIQETVNRRVNTLRLIANELIEYEVLND
jgi:hypothetical protein